MDKVLSARVDEATIRQIGLLSRKLGVTKKSVIENAILIYADTIEDSPDALEVTCGAWTREESASDTVDRVRDTFRKTINRYKP